ncbi:MAG: hypothetical protein WAO11_04005, partial [Candidatus Acidiferrum sp.]
MLFVDPCPHEINDGDVMSRLAPCAESVAEHESERSLQHVWSSRSDVVSDNDHIERRGLEGLLRFLVRNKSRIVIKRQVPFAPEP